MLCSNTLACASESECGVGGGSDFESFQAHSARLARLPYATIRPTRRISEKICRVVTPHDLSSPNICDRVQDIVCRVTSAKTSIISIAVSDNTPARFFLSVKAARTGSRLCAPPNHRREVPRDRRWRTPIHSARAANTRPDHIDTTGSSMAVLGV
jgi:hypothetical protein